VGYVPKASSPSVIDNWNNIRGTEFDWHVQLSALLDYSFLGLGYLYLKASIHFRSVSNLPEMSTIRHTNTNVPRVLFIADVLKKRNTEARVVAVKNEKWWRAIVSK
jgi:hypothetical protein